MKVEISNLAPVHKCQPLTSEDVLAVSLDLDCACDHWRTVYTVANRDECRDSVDRMVYDLVVQFNDVITIGKTIGRKV